MAEKKYDLLLGPRRNSNSKITHQPWYLERLNTKYERKPPLVASSWTFIKDGLDDFRDGKPPIIDSSIIIKGNKGIKPSLFGSNSFDDHKPKQRIKKDLNRKDIVYSKCAPNQQKRKDRVAFVERNLLNHPLALYPHIENAVPPGLFEDIIDLLDPSLALNDDIQYPEEDPPTHPTPISTVEQHLESKEDLDYLPREACSGYNKAMKSKRVQTNKNISVVEEEANTKAGRKVNPPQATKIENVTNEFCGWVRDLGGDRNNIEEATINNLFASGYDTKPTLSVPVHVVELTNVPPELRADAHLSSIDDNPLQDDTEKKAYTPSWVKVKYGAWYLDPKSWKVRQANEPLEDPKEVEGKLLSESRKKSKELDKVLSSLHGAKSFRTFIETRGARNPEFLEGVSSNTDDDDTKSETNYTSSIIN